MNIKWGAGREWTDNLFRLRVKFYGNEYCLGASKLLKVTHQTFCVSAAKVNITDATVHDEW